MYSEITFIAAFAGCFLAPVPVALIAARIGSSLGMRAYAKRQAAKRQAAKRAAR